MVSHCLKHQDKVATARCVSCSIPLCDLCQQPYEDGIYCSDRCHEAAKEGKVRVAALKKQEAETRKRQQKQTAIKLVVYLVLGLGLYFGWDLLPEGLTSVVEEFWAKMTE